MPRNASASFSWLLPTARVASDRPASSTRVSRAGLPAKSDRSARASGVRHRNGESSRARARERVDPSGRGRSCCAPFRSPASPRSRRHIQQNGPLRLPATADPVRPGSRASPRSGHESPFHQSSRPDSLPPRLRESSLPRTIRVNHPKTDSLVSRRRLSLPSPAHPINQRNVTPTARNPG